MTHSSCSLSRSSNFVLHAKDYRRNEYDDDGRSSSKGTGDMEYTTKNIMRQSKHFREIVAVDKDVAYDVYVQDVERTPNLFWYIGKIAYCSGTCTLEDAIARQWTLIQEHAVRLRPVELGNAAYGQLQIWVAPFSSEVEMSDPNSNTDLSLPSQLNGPSSHISNKEVGFFAEVVTNRGVGFYIMRDIHGKAMVQQNDQSNDGMHQL